VTKARFARREETRVHLEGLNLKLELMRVFWRFVQERTWISARQSLFIHGKIDAAGKMTGAWIKTVSLRD